MSPLPRESGAAPFLTVKPLPGMKSCPASTDPSTATALTTATTTLMTADLAAIMTDRRGGCICLLLARSAVRGLDFIK
jgi:hypothetical protein